MRRFVTKVSGSTRGTGAAVAVPAADTLPTFLPVELTDEQKRQPRLQLDEAELLIKQTRRHIMRMRDLHTRIHGGNTNGRPNIPSNLANPLRSAIGHLYHTENAIQKFMLELSKDIQASLREKQTREVEEQISRESAAWGARLRELRAKRDNVTVDTFDRVISEHKDFLLNDDGLIVVREGNVFHMQWEEPKEQSQPAAEVVSAEAERRAVDTLDGFRYTGAATSNGQREMYEFAAGPSQ
jgi:hypothetical protein